MNDPIADEEVSQDLAPSLDKTQENIPQPKGEEINSSFQTLQTEAVDDYFKKPKEKKLLLSLVLASVIFSIVVIVILFFFFQRQQSQVSKSVTKSDDLTKTTVNASGASAHNFSLYQATCGSGNTKMTISISIEKNTSVDNQYLFYYSQSIADVKNSWNYVDIIEKTDNEDYVNVGIASFGLERRFIARQNRLSFNEKSLKIVDLYHDSSLPYGGVDDCLKANDNTLRFIEKKELTDSSQDYRDAAYPYNGDTNMFNKLFKKGTYSLGKIYSSEKSKESYKFSITEKTNIGFVGTITGSDGTNCSDYFVYYSGLSGIVGNFDLNLGGDSTLFNISAPDSTSWVKDIKNTDFSQYKGITCNSIPKESVQFSYSD